MNINSLNLLSVKLHPSGLNTLPTDYGLTVCDTWDTKRSCDTAITPVSCNYYTCFCSLATLKLYMHAAKYVFQTQSTSKYLKILISILSTGST